MAGEHEQHIALRDLLIVEREFFANRIQQLELQLAATRQRLKETETKLANLEGV
jgi:hypothetical protein